MKTSLSLFILICLTACQPKINSLDQGATSNKLILEKLYQHYDQWRGTPYRLGGMSQRGIDCSGFVQITYDQEFGIQLPRTTQAQAQLSMSVSRHKLEAGDLVFFKILNQDKRHHVGLYLEDDRFLHASTSKGVIVSDLQNNYWKKNYWKAIRVLH